MSKEISISDFIAQSKAVHGDRYDYSKVDYRTKHGKVQIICKKHGVFFQEARQHLNGRGCRKCYAEATRNRLLGSYQEFVRKARAIHGNRYGYPRFEYKDSAAKAPIACPEHGIFFQTCGSHLAGCDCLKCAGRGKYATASYIQAAKAIHGSKYDYSRLDFRGNYRVNKVKIICTQHGTFEKLPMAHLSGEGCPKCAYKKRSRELLQTYELFVKKAKKVHGDRYKYPRFEYSGCNTLAPIICPEHGLFHQTCAGHLSGRGCQKCKGYEKYSKRSFEEAARKVHGDQYDYSKVDYKDVQTKIDIICPEHGIFRQTPRNHLTGSGCRKCANISIGDSRRGSYDEFVRKAKEIHGDTYVYPHFVYKDAISTVPIICPKPGHGKFSQSPNSHLNGAGCPICSTSKMEIKTADFLRANSLSFERQKKFIKERRLSFDFWIPEKDTFIECQGKQHYTLMRYFHRSPADFTLQQDKDKLKRDYAQKSGVKLIEIPYWEKDIEGFLSKELGLKRPVRALKVGQGSRPRSGRHGGHAAAAALDA